MFKMQKGKSSKIDQSKVKLESPVYLNKDLLEFWARQINILKDVADSCNVIHADVISGRIRETVHILEKKMAFSLGDNPEHYHDYIQDFYENQLENLRGELNTCKINLGIRDHEIIDLKGNIKILSSEIEIERQKSFTDFENFEQSGKIKKELEHCQLVLQENQSFMIEQSETIENLTQQIQDLQINNNKLRTKYEQKIISFDNEVQEYCKKFKSISKKLELSQKQCQQQLKETAIVKIKLTEARQMLCRELEIKTEETRLLTKKIYEQQLFINKLQKQLSMKNRVNDELYAEIDECNIYKSQEEIRNGKYLKTIESRNEENLKLEGRVRELTSQNEVLAKQASGLRKENSDIQKESQQLRKKISQYEIANENIERKNEDLQREKKTMQRTLEKVKKQKERLAEEIKLMELKNQQLFEQNLRDRDNIKKGIMTEVSELVSITGFQQKSLKEIGAKLSLKEEELTKQIHEKQCLQDKFTKMNEVIEQLTVKLDSLQKQNHQLAQSKLIVEKQLTNLMQKLDKCEEEKKKFSAKIKELSQLKIATSSMHEQKQLEDLRKQYEKEIKTLRQELQGMRHRNNEGENVSESESEVDLNLLKGEISKRQFQMKQSENKVKILQEQIRENNKHHQFEKEKMRCKIQELEQLLSSGFSDSGRH